MIRKSVRYALVAPESKVITMDFGHDRDVMEKHIKQMTDRYGSAPASMQARVTTVVTVEAVDAPVTHAEVGITLLHGSSLVLTSDNNIAVHDRENDLYISVGPATVSTLNAIIDAAERLKVHAK